MSDLRWLVLRLWPFAGRVQSGPNPWGGRYLRLIMRVFSALTPCSGVSVEVSLGLNHKRQRHLPKLVKYFAERNFALPGGNFAMTTRQDSPGQLSVSLTRLSEKGGAHDQFWRRFKFDLSAIVEEVVRLNEPDADLAVARCADLQALLDGQGLAGTWLAVMRNQINYQQRHRVWFPFGASQRDVTYVASIGYRSSRTARLDYDPNRQPLQAFAAGSLYLAAVCYEVADQLISGSVSRRGMFRSRWQKLTNDVGPELIRAS